MVPTVQEKILGVDAVREILGPVPLHIVAVLAVVTVGMGLTVIETKSLLILHVVSVLLLTTTRT